MKKKKKYLSIVLVPHSTDGVKVMKFTAFYSKLTAIVAIIITLFIALGVFVSYMVYQNAKLKASISQLKEENMQQSALLSEKSNQINELKEHESTINSKINDFMEKYREMANNLVNRSGDVRSSRSTDGSAKTYIKDINELKLLLNSLNEASNSQNKQLSSLDTTEEKLSKYIENLPTIWPTKGEISSPFGGRRDPFLGRKRFHEGIDIAASYGEAIHASAAGTVVFSGKSSGYGYNIIIQHNNNLSTLYGHCSRLIAKKGKAVKKGEVIAEVGSSGRSNGSHLHFEIRIDGEQVDPTKYLAD